MGDGVGMQGVVVLFDDEAGRITTEMAFRDYEALVSRHASLSDEYLDREIKAAYAAVDGALSVRRAVLFLLPVDEMGMVRSSFNIKLEYLGKQAGRGPDVGCGAIRLACQSQCPVPWDVGKMWEPEGTGEQHPIALLQQQVWKNALGLRKGPVVDDDDDDLPPDEGPGEFALIDDDFFNASNTLEMEEGPVFDTANAPSLINQAAATEFDTNATSLIDAAAATDFDSTPTPLVESAVFDEFETTEVSGSGIGGQTSGARPSRPAVPVLDDDPGTSEVTTWQALEGLNSEDLDVAQFMRKQSERLEAARQRFRTQLDAQQHLYLEQINTCRDEIRKLKVELRQERDRSRKLQALIRGDRLS